MTEQDQPSSVDPYDARTGNPDEERVTSCDDILSVAIRAASDTYDLALVNKELPCDTHPRANEAAHTLAGELAYAVAKHADWGEIATAFGFEADGEIVEDMSSRPEGYDS